MACGCGTCTNCKGKGGKTPKRKNAGGYLVGPSHEQGGIPATFQHGGEAIELEGGEYIINAQTVDALGVDFLDQINSTATSYHQGGFQRGQLPNPSNYKKGGKGGKIRIRSTFDETFLHSTQGVITSSVLNSFHFVLQLLM